MPNGPIRRQARRRRGPPRLLSTLADAIADLSVPLRGPLGCTDLVSVLISCGWPGRDRASMRAALLPSMEFSRATSDGGPRSPR